MKCPRVLLADDHSLVVEAFRRLLESTCEVVGTVADGHALLEAARVLKPDVVVLDLAMPRLSGLEAARRLKELMPEVKLVFVTMNEDPDLATEAMRMGASGYILKTSAASDLFLAIQAAMKGTSYVAPKIAQAMRDELIRDPLGRPRSRELTPRQREVIQLLAEGKSMKEAADILGVTPRTIAFHKYRMMEELGIKSNAELIRIGLEKHILVVERSA
jgi:DNA-binding NarL/FixJ family response regulator